MHNDDILLQRQYYRNTAQHYDSSHLAGSEHMIALSAFVGLVKNFPHASFLDVGAGTGRGIAFLRSVFPESRIIGVEPVAELRGQAFAKRIQSLQATH